VDPEQVIACVHETQTEAELDVRLKAIFPADLRVAVWNRELVQKGMSVMGREVLESTKLKMGAEQRTDVISFADMIDFDEGRIL
jgi:hypothetical protein